MKNESGLMGALLYEENEKQYLSLHYKNINGDDLYLPKVRLPIETVPYIEEARDVILIHPEYVAKWLDLELDMLETKCTVPDQYGRPVRTPSECSCIIVKNKRKMTKSEIEDALGYEIEIIGEK